jgi:hypothetical protein
MSSYEILAIGGVGFAVIAFIYIVVYRPQIGSVLAAAMLSAGFGAYTAMTIFEEGVLPVWENHTSNLWGVQVWWDLLFAVAIALFFIAPRARKMGMNIPLWALFVASTASIGLFAMIARLFWLEGQAKTEA